MPDNQRIAGLFLDERNVVRRSPQIEHERKVAIHDLLEENHFAPVGGFEGPYNLHLRIEENRLLFDVRDDNDGGLVCFALPLGSLRSIIKDYFIVCESYFNAIKTLSPSRIEAIDMGRRGLHNDGGDILRERLVGKADMDVNTARRLFTLICVLHLRAYPDNRRWL